MEDISISCANINELYEDPEYFFKEKVHVRSNASKRLEEAWARNQKDILLASKCSDDDVKDAFKRYKKMYQERKDLESIRELKELRKVGL